MKSKITILFALSLLLSLSACLTQQETGKQRSYEHIDFISLTEKEDCFLCGDRTDHIICTFWGQDNLGLINMNTFDVQAVEINKYDWNGAQIKETQGILLSGGGKIGESQIHTMTYPDRGNSHVDIQCEGNTIDPEAIGTFLCQDCLDAFAGQCFEDETLPEVAVINFATREIRPLVESCPWFTFGNYAVDCGYEENGIIDLLIYYCPLRFRNTTT